MGRIAYVNGRFLPHRDAAVHVEDRGFQFADAVYEVTAVVGGRFVDLGPHLDRLWRNMGELAITPPVTRPTMEYIHREMARRNLLGDGAIYLQVSRGAASRDFPFPAAARPTLVLTAKTVDWHRQEAMAAKGVGVVSRPDIRWGRCDIKTVGLLAAVLAKQSAKAAGAYEAILIDRDGMVTEGSSSNFWIVTREGRVVTRSLSQALLPGITRASLMRAAADAQITIEERAFTLAEALDAAEAFVTSASAFVLPVVSIDDRPLGLGEPGPVSRRLRDLYRLHSGL